MGRDEDAVTVNIDTDMDEDAIRQLLRAELNAAFGQLHECGECGLVWGRMQTGGRRSPDGQRCPDCREERNIYQTNI